MMVTMVPKYKCLKCNHIFESVKSIFGCPKCKYVYVRWVNYEKMSNNNKEGFGWI